MKENRFMRALPYVVLACAFLLSVGMYALYGGHNLNSDLSSDIVFADLLNEEGKLITDNWYYSTELRIVSAVPFYQLGLMIFDSWHAARTFAVALMLALTAASVMFLGCQANMPLTGIYGAAALMLPVSYTSMFLFTYGGCYTVYIIMVCLILGLLAGLERGKRPIRLVLLALISFWGGLNGVRLLMICAAPLLLAAVLEWYLNMRACRSVREAVCGQAAVYVYGALAVCGAIFAGYFMNVCFISRHYEFMNFSAIENLGLQPREVLKQIQYILEYFGFRTKGHIMSLGGLASLAALALSALAAISVLRMILERRQMLGAQRLVLWFALMAVAVGIVLNMLTGMSMYTERNSVAYYLPGLLLLALMMFFYIGEKPDCLPAIKHVFMLALTAVFAFQSFAYYFTEYNRGEADYEQTAQWLMDNGYTQGYATFWNANVLTEASDGEIDVYSFVNWNSKDLYRWLQKTEHFEAEPEGKVFVLVAHNEGTPSIARQENLAAETSQGRIYIYDSAQAAMDAHRAE